MSGYYTMASATLALDFRGRTTGARRLHFPIFFIKDLAKAGTRRSVPFRIPTTPDQMVVAARKRAFAVLHGEQRRTLIVSEWAIERGSNP